jgi:hypothetical protein
VKAAAGRRGKKGLREEGVKGETRRFWMLNFSPCSRDALTRGFLILNFGLAEEIGSRETLAKMRSTGVGIKEVTIKVYIPLIYIVNTSLQSKY